ncbi:hypothetical protein ACQPZF_31260 [Actinosynnema sp. CS-041913]|uniref:hypothetical protein n=1 Tax=Actinosynnema sp. CS-041913 TaxID=3239917 RepID=UPI003D8DF850
MNRRMIAAGTLSAGALLGFGGALLELYRVDAPPPRGVGGFTLTAWRIVFYNQPTTEDVMDGPQWGYPLVTASALALVAAVLLFRPAPLAAVGRFTAVIATGLLGGTAWSVHTTIRNLFVNPETVPYGFATVVGAGLWSLAGACLVLLVGAVLAQDWPRRAPKPTGVAVYRVDGDDDTPPFGIPIPTAELAVPEATDLPVPRATDVPVPGATDSPVPGAVDRTGEERPPTGGNPSTVER